MVDERELIQVIKDNATANANVVSELKLIKGSLTNLENTLTGIADKFEDVVNRYDSFNIRMALIERDMKWLMAITLGLGITITSALVKIAFF